MNMTPNKILSMPTFGLAGIVAVIGLALFVPGGLILLGALGLGWLGDKWSSARFDPEDKTTIEEYESSMLTEEEILGGYWDSEGFVDGKN